jgi:hypothetical protein
MPCRSSSDCTNLLVRSQPPALDTHSDSLHEAIELIRSTSSSHAPAPIAPSLACWLGTRHRQLLPACPPARLPACRPADLPACRPADLRFAYTSRVRIEAAGVHPSIFSYTDTAYRYAMTAHGYTPASVNLAKQTNLNMSIRACMPTARKVPVP